jgi:serpin B
LKETYYQVSGLSILSTADPILKSLGMSRTFGDLADFSGINRKPGDLRIAELRQAAVIEVDEKGIKAAAAMQAISPDSFGEEPPVFRADHPFLFLVRDNRTGCILFIGRVVNPAEEPGESSAHHAASIIPSPS